jgi:hypothetical protein
VSHPRPIPVALRRALARGALGELGAHLRGDLGFHQLPDRPGDALAQHLGVLRLQQLLDPSQAAVILWPSAIVVSFVDFSQSRRS